MLFQARNTVIGDDNVKHRFRFVGTLFAFQVRTPTMLVYLPFCTR